MKTISLRLGTHAHQLITEEAQHEGTSTSTFIREAAYARAILQRQHRNNTTGLPAEIIRAIRKTCRDDLRNS